MVYSSHQILNTLLTVRKPKVKTVPPARPQSLDRIKSGHRHQASCNVNYVFVLETTRDDNE